MLPAHLGDNLSENLLQNQVGETLDVYVFEHCVVKTNSAREHLKSSCIVLCHGSRYHFELMNVSCPCPIQVSKSLFNIFQKDVQCLHLRCPSYDCHDLIHCPDLCCASTHE